MVAAVRRTAPAALVALVLLVAVVALAACSKNPDRSVDAFCAQIRQVKDLSSLFELGDVTRINRDLDGLRLLQQVSPPDIEPQVAVLVNISSELSRTIATAKDPDLAQKEVAQNHLNDLGSIAAAGTAVQNYTNDKCHIVLNSTATGGTTPGSAPAPATTTTAPAAGKTTTSRAKAG
jgi:hypothetical protein